LANLFKDVTVIIGSSWANDIAITLNSIGVNRYYDLTEPQLHYMKSELDLFLEHEFDIDYLYNSLADDISKNILKSIIKYRLTLNPIYITKSRYNQYHHPLILPSTDEYIIDGGAYPGDSSTEFSELVGNNGHVFAFEPSFHNYINMCGNIKNKNILPLQFGLGNMTKMVKFNSSLSNQEGHSIDDNGVESIWVMDIDSFIDRFNIPHIDLIKMDIEGAETDALYGAYNLIYTYTPKLQISIYHKPEDLWDIHKTILEINKGYKFYLGHHTGSLSDTVLYAIGDNI
jgi:FkbM family methyltransferase